MRGSILCKGRGGMGDESDGEASERMIGIDPDQLAFWMLEMDAGIGLLLLVVVDVGALMFVCDEQMAES